MRRKNRNGGDARDKKTEYPGFSWLGSGAKELF
jgi:hypothetical protein